MNVAKWLLFAVLALPLVELAAFIAVAAMIGLAGAFGLLLLNSLAGMLLLSSAGGGHIARVRVAMTQGSFTSLQADRTGGALLLAGILLVIPGFVTDLMALLLLVGPLRRGVAGLLWPRPAPPHADGVVDLEPEQWRRVPDPTLPDRRGHDARS